VPDFGSSNDHELTIASAADQIAASGKPDTGQVDHIVAVPSFKLSPEDQDFLVDMSAGEWITRL